MDNVEPLTSCACSFLSGNRLASSGMFFYAAQASLRPSGVLMACLRHQITSQVLGVLASLSELTLVIFVQIILCTACPIGCLLFEHMVENFCQFVGRGCRSFGWPEFTPHAAQKRPERAGAGAETVRGHAQGATGAIVDPPTARGAHVASTDLIIGTESQPGGKMFVCRPCMHIEADLCEDDMNRWCL